MRFLQSAAKTGIVLSTSVILCACQTLETVKTGDSNVIVSTSATQTNAVCNPFGNGNSLGGNHGLKASLYYAGPDASLPEYSQVADYINKGVEAEAEIYFDHVNVPTRSFEEGFMNGRGQLLTNLEGNTLYEWFALDFYTSLQLTPSNSSGAYQFALISDDGANLYQKVNGQWQTLINNDWAHPTQVKLANQPVYLDQNSQLPLHLEYFQGPRWNIALILLWRPWPEGCAPSETGAAACWEDPLDGQSGNDLLFDWHQNPSVPNDNYNSFIARGWKVIPADNYYLPNPVAANPCTSTSTDTATSTSTAKDTGTSSLAIVGFDGTTTNNSASMIWQTINVPSTGSIAWGYSPTTLTNLVPEGAGSVTTHLVIVPGLVSGMTYYFQASSTDANGKIVQSEVISKTTK